LLEAYRQRTVLIGAVSQRFIQENMPRRGANGIQDFLIANTLRSQTLNQSIPGTLGRHPNTL
jgi:hypothetical protein